MSTSDPAASPIKIDDVSGSPNGNQKISTSGSVVPSGLPLFQWFGAVCDEKKEEGLCGYRRMPSSF